jgi:L-amino acid N-acyltransferase YncA
VGGALVAAAVDAALEPGAERLDRSVIAGNVAALHLYRAAGFETWGRQPQAVRMNERDLDELFMTLPLRAGRAARPRRKGALATPLCARLTLYLRFAYWLS